MLDKKVRERYKHLKYQYLKKAYDKNLSKLPGNCKFNKKITFPNGNCVSICGFNFDERIQVDLCYTPEHSKDCNAFVSKYSKDQIRQYLIEDLRNELARSTFYKDLNVLLYLYPELESENFTVKLTLIDKLWATFNKIRKLLH